MLVRTNKKGEGLATNKLIIIIICVIVLAAVLIFMFRGSINNWIQNLPGYGSQEDKEINVTEDRPGVSRLCKIRVAELVYDKGKGYSYLKFEGYMSKLYLSGKSGKEATIYADQDWEIDDAVGEIKNGLVSIYNEILVQSGARYEEVKNEIPTNALMKQLNGAYYYESVGNLKLCRDEPVK
jgi:hypothetical protein